jgi:hypothetical protein
VAFVGIAIIIKTYKRRGKNRDLQKDSKTGTDLT